MDWAPELVWTTWRKESSCPYRDTNSEITAVQPAASRYTNWAIPAPVWQCSYQLLNFSVLLILRWSHQGRWDGHVDLIWAVGNRVTYKTLNGEPEGNIHLENLDVDGRIILSGRLLSPWKWTRLCRYRHFGRTIFLHFLDRKEHLFFSVRPERGDSWFFRTVGNNLPDYTSVIL
jgi:hypothetical protein